MIYDLYKGFPLLATLGGSIRIYRGRDPQKWSALRRNILHTPADLLGLDKPLRNGLAHMPLSMALGHAQTVSNEFMKLLGADGASIPKSRSNDAHEVTV